MPQSVIHKAICYWPERSPSRNWSTFLGSLAATFFCGWILQAVWNDVIGVLYAVPFVGYWQAVIFGMGLSCIGKGHCERCCTSSYGTVNDD